MEKIVTPQHRLDAFAKRSDLTIITTVENGKYIVQGFKKGEENAIVFGAGKTEAEAIQDILKNAEAVNLRKE